MFKLIKLILILCIPCLGLCQDTFHINGKFIEKIQKNDAILFLSEFSNHEYYEKDIISAGIENNNFSISGEMSYPQMFRIRLKSETDKIPYRGGFYFIDSSTSSMVIGETDQLSEVNGRSGNEYKQKFIPYFIKAGDKKEDIEKFTLFRGQEFDTKLLNYVNQYPNSYVALWFLITRFNYDGYSNLQSQILNSFSNKIKSKKLWKVVNTEFAKIRIRDGFKFPQLLLKDTALNEEALKVPEKAYTLIDFWFSRCRPCLDQLPQLKEIYNKYNSKGFNIIGISTDLTKNVAPYWQKRIVENQIPWKNYLDENAKEATQEKIFSFPTNYLLDKQGNVIKKNISLDDLDNFLGVHLIESPNINDRRKF